MQYGKKVVGIHHADPGKVSADFADGTSYHGSIAIGTDGAQSAVRQILLGAETGRSRSLGVILYNLNVCYGDAERALEVRRLHPMNTVALQPDRGLSVWTSSM